MAEVVNLSPLEVVEAFKVTYEQQVADASRLEEEFTQTLNEILSDVRKKAKNLHSRSKALSASEIETINSLLSKVAEGIKAGDFSLAEDASLQFATMISSHHNDKVKRLKPQAGRMLLEVKLIKKVNEKKNRSKEMAEALALLLATKKPKKKAMQELKSAVEKLHEHEKEKKKKKAETTTLPIEYLVNALNELLKDAPYDLQRKLDEQFNLSKLKNRAKNRPERKPAPKITASVPPPKPY